MSDSDDKALKKEWAKLKREASDLAAEVHDIVEERLWSDFERLPALADQLKAACERANAFKAENGL